MLRNDYFLLNWKTWIFRYCQDTRKSRSKKGQTKTKNSSSFFRFFFFTSFPKFPKNRQIFWTFWLVFSSFDKWRFIVAKWIVCVFQHFWRVKIVLSFSLDLDRLKSVLNCIFEHFLRHFSALAIVNCTQIPEFPFFLKKYSFCTKWRFSN